MPDCLTAAHVSRNLGISYECLKADLTPKNARAGSGCPADSGKRRMTLSEAIRALHTGADVKAEIRRAKNQVEEDGTHVGAVVFGDRTNSGLPALEAQQTW